MMRFALLSCVLLVGCGGDVTAGTDAGTTPTQDDGGVVSGTPLTQAQCESLLDRMTAAGCADAANWTQLKSVACGNLAGSLATSYCAQPLASAGSAYAGAESATFACGGFGATDTTSVEAQDVLLGILCAAVVNNNRCAGVACEYDSDCPSGAACNGVTQRCAEESAPCVGLPCEYDVDCPDGLECNGAVGQCVAN